MITTEHSLLPQYEVLNVMLLEESEILCQKYKKKVVILTLLV